MKLSEFIKYLQTLDKDLDVKSLFDGVTTDVTKDTIEVEKYSKGEIVICSEDYH